MTLAAADTSVLASPQVPREAAIWAWAFGLAALLGCLAIAVAPLAAYVWLIALFGIPHVLAEMRYCDERFSSRTSRPALLSIVGILAVLAAVRLLGTYGGLSGQIAGPLELGLGAALAIAAAIFMRRRRILGFGAATLVVFGALYYPMPTFLIWAWLHNLTPIGFVAERLTGRVRTRAILALSLPFFLLPGVVAMGGLAWIAAGLFGHDAATASSALGAGFRPLQAFLPSGMNMADALPLFQAAVLAQVMHYVAVIVLLPRLLPARTTASHAIIRWPNWGVFYLALAAGGLVSLAIYAFDFGQARSAYALAATLHSWIELPVFLMALGGGFIAAMPTGIPQSPTPH